MRTSYCLLLLLGCSTVAVADSPNYNYTELSYGGGELKYDEAPELTWDQQGGEIEGSYAFNNTFWVYGGYARMGGRSDETNAKLNYRNAILRAGYVFYPGEIFSVDVSVLARKDRYKEFNSSDRGAGLGAGVRANIAMFEFFARGDYLTGDFDGGWALDTGAIWRIGDHFGVTLSYEATDYKSESDAATKYQLNLVQLGLRFTFPRD